MFLVCAGLKGLIWNLCCFFIFCFAVSLFAGKPLYTLKPPAGNVMIRVFKIMGVRNSLRLFDLQPLFRSHATLPERRCVTVHVTSVGVFPLTNSSTCFRLVFSSWIFEIFSPSTQCQIKSVVLGLRSVTTGWTMPRMNMRWIHCFLWR